MLASLTGMKRLWALIQSVLLAEGLVVVTIAVFRWLDPAKSLNIIDILFLEGALLMVAGGLCDLSKSITFSHIRALIRSKTSPPPSYKRTGLAGILLIAGLLVCANAVVWTHW